MSRYWNIECKRCGLEIFEDSYGWTNNRGGEFAELCASGMLSMNLVSTSVWGLRIVYVHDIHIRIGTGRLSTGCDHDFEPRDEYGNWATSDMWPDWHPKSRVTEGMGAVSCTGVGDGRCIGD